MSAPAYTLDPPAPPERVLEGELKAFLFRRSGDPAAQAEVTLLDSLMVTETDSNGAFSIPVSRLSSSSLQLKLRDRQRVVVSQIQLPESILRALNKGRSEMGQPPFMLDHFLSRSLALSAVETASTVPIAVVFEQALGLQLPENKVVVASAGDSNSSERRQLLLSYPVPVGMRVGDKRASFWTQVENASNEGSVRLKWQNTFAEDAQVRIAFARSEGELSAWNGTAESVPQWSGAETNASLVTDFSDCSERGFNSASEGPLTSADESRCGFDRNFFPFAEGVDVFIRVVGESTDEIRFSPVFKIRATNAAPILSPLSGRSTPTNTALLNVPITLNDADTGLECSVALDIVSANQALLLDENILIGGSIPNCTASFFPEDDFSGTSEISVRASDGSLRAATAFKLTVGEWVQEAYIKAPNTSQMAESEGDAFGSVVALSADTLAVGAALEDSNAVTITNGESASADQSSGNSGAVYVYIRSGNFWLQQAYIKASNGDSGDQFGTSIALSGDVLVVGSSREDSNETVITNGSGSSEDNSMADTGAVYVYRRTSGLWSQEAYFKAGSSVVDDRFGESLALHENTIAVGVPSKDSTLSPLSSSGNNTLSNSGSVFVYRRSDAGWNQEAQLEFVHRDSSDQFGNSVALVNDTLAVGVLGDDSDDTAITNGTSAGQDNAITDSGAVFVYRRNGVSWSQEAYLKAVNNRSASVYYGHAVSLSADTLAVGAVNENAKETSITNGASASDDVSLWESGAVYVYRRTGNTWAQEAYIKASNSDEDDHFGSAVSLSATLLAVGAKDESANQSVITTGEIASSDDSAIKSGAVYLYHRTGTLWRQESYIKAVNVGAGDLFGSSVSISDFTLAVGAPGEDSNQTTILNGPTASSDNSSTESGAVYIYRKL